MPAPRDARPVASMADVAARAGVSHQTVSRVLNAPDKVRAATRERVQRAMDELEFRPNAAARALVTRSSRLIGLVLPGENLFGPTHTMIALDVAARELGYSTTLGVLGGEGGVEQVLRRFERLNVDAVVVIAPDRAALDAAQALARRLPVAVICGIDPAELGLASGLAVVHIDQARAAAEVVAHLARAGVERIDHVAGPAHWFDAQARIAGWRSAVAEAGLDGLLVGAGWGAGSGAEAFDALVPGAPTGGRWAVFCANDQLALGVVHRAAAHGLAVPGQLLVVGFDDTDGCDFFLPSLTSVRQPFERAGQLAMALVLEVMASAPPRTVRVEPSLVVRASSQVAPNVQEAVDPAAVGDDN